MKSGFKPARDQRVLKRVALGSALVSALSSAHAADQLGNVEINEKAEAVLKKQDATATKMDVSIKDTGRSITQLDSQDLEDRGLTDIRQAFDYVAGFRANGPADRTYTARGVRTSIDNVMVDGLRSLQGGEAGTGSRLPSTFNAESTTFVRGPEGLLYGSGVGGGIVNITTKKPQEEAATSIGLTTRSYLSDDTGNFDQNSATLKLDSTGPLAGDKVLYRVIADVTPNGEHFQEGREVDEKMLDAALAVKVSPRTTITPQVQISERDKTGGSGYADGVFESNFASGNVEKYGEPTNRGKYYGSPNDKGHNKSESVGVNVEHAFENGWKLTARGRRNETSSESLDLYISDSSGLKNEVGNDTINRKWVYSKGEDKYSLIDAAVQGKFKTGDIEHHLLAGMSYKDMDVKFARKFQANDDAFGNNTISAGNPDNQQVGPIPADLKDATLSPRSEKDTNIYLKDRIKLGDVTVAAGLAYIKQEQHEVRSGKTYEETFSDTIWDLGLIYALNKNVNLFATYSRAYDPVSGRYIAQYGQGKTDYKPEEGNNYELGFKGLFNDGKLATSVTFFQLDRENKTQFERIDGKWHLLQPGGTTFKSEGVEIETTARITPQITTSISYAYTRAYDTKGEDRKKQANNTPKHSLAAWTGYQMTGELSPLRFALGIRHEGERNDGDYKLTSYTEADIGAYYETADWDLSVLLRNALDKNRAEAGANWVTVQPNEPRSLNVAFKYHF